ncbi:Xaa-Pro aminopeptidase [Halopenitus malekzadehii]|uniref:Xaa-Pro aminopeptidase n=1 Tax=Halopenitus malekzadehii TaxID=1267564 RepID=A0A1H6I0C4_9EURY|nr:Xaa-Pro peptidase family protein [Halopenitus malekzadehii]SEH40863.1 Xaa-Pro aminopeptidase [Halopenitus malekzadehii]
MTRDLPALAETIAGRDVDGYLIDADWEDPTQLYLSGFTGPDPFLTLYADGGVHLLVSGLEYARAKRESRADTVRRHAEYDFQYGGRERRLDMYADFLADVGVESVLMPDRAPVGTADGLRDRGITVAVDHEDAVASLRAVKSDDEVNRIRTAQRATESAMAAAESLLSEATVEDGTLVHGGDVLTSERVREEIEVTLLRHGCASEETIVAGGAHAADPHDRGSGPLSAGDAIVIDVFPRDTDTKYFADMTRTFVVGEPGDALRERYDLTVSALEAAIDAVEPGATGEDVHVAACEVYEDAGYPTLRSDPDTDTGYIHSTGHGVGLAVHEPPRLSMGAGELEPGNVVTIEPGLYDPDVGGIRVEDLVVVTTDGCEVITDYPKRFVIE